MRRLLPAILLVLLGSASAGRASGLLIPTEKSVPPLAMLNHHVRVTIEDQVALTRVEQTFRNHTDRQLEATYIFPVPKGASVRKFSMWVDGKEVKGELVEAKKAAQIYTDIVRRTQDPGLLEYMGTDLLKLRVFPVPAKGDQKLSVTFTSVSPSDGGLIEYRYPLKTDGRAASTLEKFSVNLTLKSQHPLLNIYSPTHAISVMRPGDKQAEIVFEKDQAILDKDFQLFYAVGGKDVGLTTLTHRPSPGDAGYFMLLISPRSDLSKEYQVPRDMIFVLDTSGSMRGKRMEQAQKALKYCLSNLTSRDRFGLMNFATVVNKYTDDLLPADKSQIEKACKWVDGLEATGGTAINEALATALAMRTSDTSRPFTIVFFTDGRPTIGETNPDRILKNVQAQNTANTRIFTFGVGDDVNASMLDQLSEQSRAISTYVRESEDIEAKVSGLYAKISNPVLTNLKLAVGPDVKISDVYPPQLPDLFHGGQLVVLGRYSGAGHAAVKLTGQVGKLNKEFVYEVNFPDRAAEEKTFVEDLWARRKVGYLLDQIRLNGEKKELVDEVTALARRYGITTPYTSYLIVPDAPLPVARAPHGGMVPGFGVPGPGGPGGSWNGTAPVPPALRGGGFGGGFGGNFGGGGLGPAGGYGTGGAAGDKMAKGGKGKSGTEKTAGASKPGGMPKSDPATAKLTDFAKQIQKEPGGLAKNRGKFEDDRLRDLAEDETAGKDSKGRAAASEAREQKKSNDMARTYLERRKLENVQAGQLGVDLSVQTNNLRNQIRLSNSAVRNVYTRECLEVGGVWIDQGFDAKMKTVTVKAQSNAYFRILERQPKMRDVFRLGNYVVWVTPCGDALVIDANDGVSELPDADIDRLFVARKK
jgi:Ca-activated chloride channel family protein